MLEAMKVQSLSSVPPWAGSEVTLYCAAASSEVPASSKSTL